MKKREEGRGARSGAKQKRGRTAELGKAWTRSAHEGGAEAGQARGNDRGKRQGGDGGEVKEGQRRAGEAGDAKGRRGRGEGEGGRHQGAKGLPGPCRQAP